MIDHIRAGLAEAARWIAWLQDSADRLGRIGRASGDFCATSQW